MPVSFCCLIFLIIASFAAPLHAQTGDPGRKFPLATVFWFNNYDPARTVWDNCQIYHSPDSGVQTASQVWNGKTISGLPLQNIDGTRALVLNTINSGYWNIFFLLGDGAAVNLERVGISPVLHLRMRWANRLPGGADDLILGLGNARVALKMYVTPSTTSWQDVSIPLTDFIKQDPHLDLTHVGAVIIAGAQQHTAESLVYFSEIAVLPSTSDAAISADQIKVDQSGWRPGDPKRALLTSPVGYRETSLTQFQVCRTRDGRVVAAGNLSAAVGSADWNLSGDTVLNADFDSLVTPGHYIVKVPALNAVSPVFTIADQVYDKDFRDALRFYYYERSGCAIATSSGEGEARPAVFPDNAAATYHYSAATGNYHYVAPTRDVLGGWLDAGDPSIQTASHAVALWWLLEMLRTMGRKVPPGSLHLPEKARTGVSDLVPLTDYGLHWLGKMQNPDGSVLTQVAWGEGKHQQCSDADSPSAAWAAGAFAKAALVLRAVPGCRQKADFYLAKAKLSWHWLVMHPQLVTAVTAAAPAEVRYDQQCRLFAAVELFNATGDSVYHRAFLEPFAAAGNDVLTAFGGSHTGYETDHVMGYLNGPAEVGYLDYISSPQPLAVRLVQRSLRQAFLHQANVAAYDPTGQHRPYLMQTPYHFAMLFPSHLYWGSNANVLSTLGVVCTRAYEWTGNAHYLHAALENLHFIHGRNPVNRHFISGEAADYAHGCDFYSQFWTDLHHQPPGVAGAFIDVDGLLQPHIKDPWKRFLNYQAASAEEPDIYWNCEYAYLVGYFASGLSGKPLEK